MCRSDTLQSSDSVKKTKMKRNTAPKSETSEPLGEFGLKKWNAPHDFVPFGIPHHLWNLYLFILPSHIGGIYGLYLTFTGQTTSPFWNGVFLVLYGYAGGIGVTAGAHRLWTHKAYKANKALQWFLMILHTSTIQYPVIKWCRDHRIHHKYVDTDADPHSAARGFWFSHMGWVIQPEHPEVSRKEKQIPMDDLENNPILDFQARYYWRLVFLTAFVIPMAVGWYFFPQSWGNLIAINYIRWLLMTHVSACVNSVAHVFGDRPYDKNQSAVDNKILSIFTVGEAWHNFHHAFPFDYKTSELPFYTFNVSTAFIDFCAYMGWAWDMKTVSQEMIDDRARRTGDGSHHHHHYEYPDPEEIKQEETVDTNEEDIEIFRSKLKEKHPEGESPRDLIVNLLSKAVKLP